MTNYWVSAGFPKSENLPSPEAEAAGHAPPPMETIRVTVQSESISYIATDVQEADTMSFDFTTEDGHAAQAVIVGHFYPHQPPLPYPSQQKQLQGHWENEETFLVSWQPQQEPETNKAPDHPGRETLRILAGITTILDESQDFEQFRRRVLSFLADATGKTNCR